MPIPEYSRIYTTVGLQPTGRLGMNEPGQENQFRGIYQRYHENGKVYVRKIKYYSPAYRRTAAQDSRRLLFAEAISLWQGWTLEQKNKYNRRAINRCVTGFNLHIHRHMIGLAPL